MRSRNLKKQLHLSQDALLSYFNFFPNCFSKIYVAELGVQHICECSFDVYDTCMILNRTQHITHSHIHAIRGQQSVNFARRVVLPVLLLLFYTATALKVAPESFRF